MTNQRSWDGRDVSAMERSEIALTEKLIRIDLRPQAARELAMVLGRLTQTTLPLPGSMEELRQALNYVTTDDATARRAHDRMEAGKGMTPDGGYKAPEGSVVPPYFRPGFSGFAEEETR